MSLNLAAMVVNSYKTNQHINGPRFKYWHIKNHQPDKRRAGKVLYVQAELMWTRLTFRHRFNVFPPVRI